MTPKMPGLPDINSHFSAMQAREDAACLDYPMRPPQSTVKLRGDYARAAADFRLAQNYDGYTADEQAIWRTLYERQLGMLAEHAAPEFMAGLRLLGADAHRIPVLEEASERLKRLTGFEVIGVPGPDPRGGFLRAPGGAPLSRSRCGCVAATNSTIWSNPICSTISSATCPCWRTRCSRISSRPTAPSARTRARPPR